MSDAITTARADHEERARELAQATTVLRQAQAAATAARVACETAPGKRTLDAMRAARVAAEHAADELAVYQAREAAARGALARLERARGLAALAAAQERASEGALALALQPIIAELAGLARAVHERHQRVDALLAAQREAWLEAEQIAATVGVPARAAKLDPELAATLVRVALHEADVPPDAHHWIRPEATPRLISEPQRLHELAKQLLRAVEA